MSLKLLSSLIIFSILFSNSFAEEVKKEEVKKEEVKKEEVKKEEVKKEEVKKEEAKKEEVKKEEIKKDEVKVVVAKKVSPPKPKECVYQTGSLAIIGQDKFDDEVKKIQNDFEKCESGLIQLKEKQARAQECHKMHEEVKEKRMAIYKLISASKIITKEDFEKSVALIKGSKEEHLKVESKYKESCHPKEAKVEVKKEEAKVEVKKEEVKVEVKKEEAKVEVKKEEIKKEEAKK